jgi:formate hydrogenlyase subunit 3/multisubunit Na+/H+ antiporter MnhD subunit
VVALLLVLAPLAALPVLAWASRAGPTAARVWTVAATAAVFLGTLASAPAVLRAGSIGVQAPGLAGGLGLAIDGTSLLAALAATAVWTLATLQATAQIAADGRAGRYHAASLAALSAMLGVLFAADLVTLYLAFEWLGLLGYLLVVHDGTPAAERAGLKYLVLVLLGGLALLAGVLLLQAPGGLAAWSAVPTDGTVPAGVRGVAAALLALGFAVKVGALGVHVWLPDAHGNAPAPASALLSGVIVNAGAFGLLRTVTGPYRVDGGAPGWSVAQGEGLALGLLAIGALTALAGAVMALLQHHPKRLLAYSTVSQMGFVTLGIGTIGLAPGDSLAWSGTMAHLAHHALVKGVLFLTVGAAIHATGVADVRRLAGVARRMPWTFAAATVAAAAITGLPFTSGFASKTALHHALAHLAEHPGSLALAAWIVRAAEPAFSAAAVGTAAALAKLILPAWFGRPAGDGVLRAHRAAWPERAASGLGAAAIVALGLRPQALAPLIDAGRRAWGLGPGEAGADLTGWSADPRTAVLALATVVGGIVAYRVAEALRLDAERLPGWASWDRIGTTVALGLYRLTTGVARPHERPQAPVAGRAWRAWTGSAERRGPLAGPVRRAWRRWVAPADEAHGEERTAGAVVPRPGGPVGGRAIDRLATALTPLIAWTRRIDASGRLSEPRPGSPGASDDDVRAAARDRWVRANRTRIERLARDIGLDVGWVVAAALAFAAALALGMPGPG